uniref:Uncharacterized protein n=1 Tax=Anguilla anguilla TaxID=7936 RepID=A0A0E9THP3_ANGAN
MASLSPDCGNVTAVIIPLLYVQPCALPLHTDLLSQVNGEIHHPCPERVALWAWPVRGITSTH